MRRSGKSCTTSAICRRREAWASRRFMTERLRSRNERLAPCRELGQLLGDGSRIRNSPRARKVAKAFDESVFDRIPHYVLVILSQEFAQAICVHDAFAEHVRSHLGRYSGDSPLPGKFQGCPASPFPEHANHF